MSSRELKEPSSTQREDDSATRADGSSPEAGGSSTGATPLLDYATVSRYWSKAKPSILDPYMMAGFGFPASAGRYRFDAECEVVERLIRSVNSDGAVLDLGSGVGLWTEYFAQRFCKVTAIEASLPLYGATVARCSKYANATLLNDDVLGFEPDNLYSMIFLGGMLMYLNESDVISLLKRVTPFLEPGGIVLCRESTVRSDTLTRQGDYQVVYRSVQTYSSLFSKCGLSVDHVELNTPYFLMQMGCEFIKRWKAIVPGPLQAIPLVGGLTYRMLRMGGAGLTRLPEALGIDFPMLTNHFFVLRRDSEVPAVALR
ncbi:MAG: class I SAM-dependent methyltransferase [Deltaproteobacteria bacterium]|nr:class I SAM-dependent methyltransferase [Deltaproteobacteria bacterium]